ncbi:hypothetical protein [Mangrovicoccus sp. HB161399]|uniref:hypothetical protein n=1 Tax=Mangrovicoccus sp. HB161399 TaxID=2720392 RepID=UPI00155348E3|nr:hypothetical protein [Mangrovicoccus sp. HB161399]
MDEVLLHIGMHKTGTTSIQSAVAGYDDGETVHAQLQFPNHSAPLYTAFSSGRLQYHFWRNFGFGPAQIEERRTAYLAMLDAQLARKDRRRLLISGEDISILAPPDKVALIEFLAARVPKIRVICYLRSPAGYAGSAFQQRITGGISQLPLHCSPLYKLRVEAFRRDPRVTALDVREFSRDRLVGGDVVEDFAALLGLDAGRLVRTSLNESLGETATKLLYHFNKVMPLSGGDKVLMQARQEFARELAATYPSAPIPAHWLGALADASEVDYVAGHFGFAFGSGEQDAPPSRDELEAYMADLSAIDLAGLDGLLAGHGLAGRFPGATEKLVRLYLWHVYDRQMAEAARRQAAPA